MLTGSMDKLCFETASVVLLTAAVISLHGALTTALHPGTKEVQTFVVIHHPTLKLGHGNHHHAAPASPLSSSFGYQIHRETSHHVPALISSGQLSPLLRTTAAQTAFVNVQHLPVALHHHHHHRHHQFHPEPLVLLGAPTRLDRLAAQSSSFRHNYNPFLHMPSYPAYPGRNAALGLEEDLLTEAEAEPTLKVYKADAEYPPLNLKNRKKLYAVGYIYMLDFLEDTYLRRRRRR
ncbi:uncharacterized protein ISCGN_021007 [Ixodes scapularis]